MEKRFITEISLEDFKRLNLIGYRNVKVCYDENRNETTEDKCKYYNFQMREISLNKIVDDNLDFCKENEWTTIAVAIHNEPTKEDIERNKQTFTLDPETGKRRNLTDDEAYQYALLDASYLDKFMNRFSGHQTFQIGCGIEHLYSNRDYWYATEDYWRVKKKETKAIYLIHLN